MLRVKWLVDKIQPQSDKFATGVENKATDVSKVDDSPECIIIVVLIIYNTHVEHWFFEMALNF